MILRHMPKGLLWTAAAAVSLALWWAAFLVIGALAVLMRGGK